VEYYRIVNFDSNFVSRVTGSPLRNTKNNERMSDVKVFYRNISCNKKK